MKYKNTNKADVAPAQSEQHTPLESELLEALKSAQWHLADNSPGSVSVVRSILATAIAKAEGRE